MKTSELRNRIRIKPTNYGWYNIKVLYRGYTYSFSDNNTTAVDRINSDAPERKVEHGYTYRQALEYYWNRCVLYIKRNEFVNGYLD